MGLTFAILGIVFVVYYIVLMMYTGTISGLFLFWLVLGILCILAAVDIRVGFWKPSWKKTLLWGRVFLTTTAAVGVLIFLIAEGLIIGEMVRKPDEQLDYIIVLGARIDRDVEALEMEKCLEAALGYLQDNPETKIIVSGNDSLSYNGVSEASVMKDWLTEHDISSDRIIMEERANSVQENIIYSMEYVEDSEATIGVVTMNFHVFRAKMIAKKEGVTVSTIPSKTDYVLLVHEMVREFFALIKDKLIANI